MPAVHDQNVTGLGNQYSTTVQSRLDMRNHLNQSVDDMTAAYDTQGFAPLEPKREKYLVYLGDSRGCVHMATLYLA